ncbi:protein kinase, partial [candidate division KSB1 bacterium]|nr:protein kinase [candidate division KSB1 bacterium]
MVGETVSHYKILDKLGEGGMGVVYKAQDLKLDRFVALKFLPLHLSAEEVEKQRFIHEAKAASALEHPNICNIHEIDEISIEGRDQMFICMAYYQGETLEKKIGRGPLKIDEAIDIAIQISEGLARAHEAGIVHRDIKPANIMMTDRGEVKILDFGLAKLRGRTKLTKTGTTLGTLAYMSPEQAKGEEMDHRSDIFSFGAVLYEMLTGLHAFKSENEGAVVYSILNEEPEPMTGLRTGVPMELERLVNKALNKSKEERYQHMDEMRVDLKALTLKVRKDSGYRLEKVESLAVMPFSNASGKEELEYLSEGITESLITNLSQISNFKVISRTSVFHYKGQHIEVQKVARELNVNKLLLGWVSRRSDDVSIGIELVEGSDNSQIWGEQYTRKFTDVVQIQEEIVKDISTKLKLKLTRKEKKHLSKQHKTGNEAYQLFLKGRYHWNKRDPDSFKQSISFYNQAIEKDPTYALAYSGLSDSYALIGIYGYLPAKDVWPKAKAAALKALEIDPDMAEAHNALGAVESSYEWNWAKAEKSFQHSIALNP